MPNNIERQNPNQNSPSEEPLYVNTHGKLHVGKKNVQFIDNSGSERTIRIKTISPYTSQKKTTSALVLDFDHTVANGHLNNAIVNAMREDRNTDPHDVTINFLNENGFINKDALTTKILDALNNGIAVAVASHSGYPTEIKTAMTKLLGQDASDKIMIVTCNDNFAQTQHIKAPLLEQIQEAYGIDDRSHILLVDDNKMNIENIKAAGYDGVRLKKSSNEYLSKINEFLDEHSTTSEKPQELSSILKKAANTKTPDKKTMQQKSVHFASDTAFPLEVVNNAEKDREEPKMDDSKSVKISISNIINQILDRLIEFANTLINKPVSSISLSKIDTKDGSINDVTQSCIYEAVLNSPRLRYDHETSTVRLDESLSNKDVKELTHHLKNDINALKEYVEHNRTVVDGSECKDVVKKLTDTLVDIRAEHIKNQNNGISQPMPLLAREMATEDISAATKGLKGISKGSTVVEKEARFTPQTTPVQETNSGAQR